jgi:HTH-type transcriptional regulator/antitoxin HigA
MKGRRNQSSEAVAAWLRMGEIKAQKKECELFKQKKLRKVIPEIRAMTTQQPDQFMNNLYVLLASAGVALVLCPHLAGTYAQGATFWMGKDKGVVMMTIRGKWADIFWFSLFHELGHILLHSRQAIFLEGGDGDPNLVEQEREADRFAEDILIPRDKYEDFVTKKRFYPGDIEKFAELVSVSAGIVVGRLQNDGYLKRSWHNNLRSRFEWRA